MKRLLATAWFKKYGKKALFIYLCWCLIKGFLFLYAGYKLLE
ncbi:hypothetical protein [Terrimonas alba]